MMWLMLGLGQQSIMMMSGREADVNIIDNLKKHVTKTFLTSGASHLCAYRGFTWSFDLEFWN